MAGNTIPLAVDDELLNALRSAAQSTRLSTADVMRQSMKLGLPELLERLKVAPTLKPFTPKEARVAFAPDPEWDSLERARGNRSHSQPEED